MGKNSKFCNFWAISTCYTSKESIFHIEFKFQQKSMISFKKNWKNSILFLFFFWKSMLSCWLKLQNFHTCAKKFENWVDLCSGKVLNFIVTKREIILWNHLEMVNGYLQWWLLVPPPSLIRVKTLRLLLKIFSEPVNLTKFFTHFWVKLTCFTNIQY